MYYYDQERNYPIVQSRFMIIVKSKLTIRSMIIVNLLSLTYLSEQNRYINVTIASFPYMMLVAINL